MNEIYSNKRDAKKLIKKLGACSRTFFYLLNREFGFPNEDMERASGPLAGGIMQQGYQCGMLWGCSLAAGAESYRRYNDRDKAVAAAAKTLKTFHDETDYEFQCNKISGENFKTIDNHTEFIKSGGCSKLIDVLAES
jgi:hypothetical protein